eukprot:TRINITY_DN42020_c0_g1_i2.p1 TRINITY_DN42020_c0_g1~~TRINITY_DN42020_c0_g1_i2.p1  ORF type:complete len:247 (+),score=36.35 TRINITY_DN42020_c0_g1_i2:46-741(+)
MDPLEVLPASGRAFQAALTAEDVQQIGLARDIFVVSTLAPVVVYYLVVPNARFPATVSYIGRQGAPFWVGTSLWLVGWATWLGVFQRRGDAFARFFSLKMWAAGFCTNTVFRLGKGKSSDWLHFLFGGVYILDHEVMFWYCNTPAAYVLACRVILAIFFVSTPGKIGLQHALKVAPDGCGEAAYPTEMEKLTPRQRKMVWACEAVQGLSEHAYFLCFLFGAVAGLPQNAGK